MFRKEIDSMSDILALTTSESQELIQCEAVIEKGLRTFVDVGNALLIIRDRRLYRAEYGTFEDYCRERWSLERRRAYQLMDAAQVVQNVNHGSQIEPPQSERQARPLSQLEPEQQREAWAQVVAESPDGRITGAKVQEVVNRWKVAPGAEGDPDEEDERQGCSDCRYGTASQSDPEEYWCERYQRAVSPNTFIYCDMEDWEPEEPKQFYETTNARQDVAVTVFSSESNEYYTPPAYIEAARQVMGGIDLDPASCENAQRTVQAAMYYSEQDDGLLQDWRGRVWMNPPYGKVGNESSQGYWAQYLISQHEKGNVTEAVFLVKAAVGYEWFEVLWDKLPVCFARERVSFIREDGNDDGQSKQGTAFFYIGPNVPAFTATFRQFGRIILPEHQL